MKSATYLLPQQPPMVMVDELIEVTTSKAVSRFLVSAKNIFVAHEKFQECGLLENIAQTAAAQAGFFQKEKNLPPVIGYLAAIKSMEISELPAVGSRLVTTVRILNQIGDITILTGEIRVNENIICSCEMRIFVRQPLEGKF